MTKQRRRWSIYNPTTKKYVARRGGKIAWTYDLEEARQMAKIDKGAVIVDTDWFVVNWHTVRDTGVVPSEHQSPKKQKKTV